MTDWDIHIWYDEDGWVGTVYPAPMSANRATFAVTRRPTRAAALDDAKLYCDRISAPLDVVRYTTKGKP